MIFDGYFAISDYFQMLINRRLYIIIIIIIIIIIKVSSVVYHFLMSCHVFHASLKSNPRIYKSLIFLIMFLWRLSPISISSEF